VAGTVIRWAGVLLLDQCEQHGPISHGPFVWRAALHVYDTGFVAEWVGLAGVLAGALIAFLGQVLAGRVERQDQDDALFVEQSALVIAMCEDYRDRVWDERKHVASDRVAAWDSSAYRLAEARLRVLSQDPDVLAALKVLHLTSTALGQTWRTRPEDETAVDSAWIANRAAIDRFASVGSKAARRRAGLRVRLRLKPQGSAECQQSK
jgi:hypothetical protein